MLELISLDLSNYCSKQCSFCYNHSTKEGNVLWQPQEVIDFATDCVQHGIKAVSLGGGEPFEYDGIFQIIDALYDQCYLSVTTNGLPLLQETVWKELLEHQPDKIHITIHQPDHEEEVERVMAQVEQLKTTNIKPGVNLLVGADKAEAAQAVYRKLKTQLHSDQIILVPQRFSNTPTPRQLAQVADRKPFQSPSCLLGCVRPHSFVSVSWDKKVNSCSYALGKQPLPSLDYAGMVEALERVRWKSCCPTT